MDSLEADRKWERKMAMTCSKGHGYVVCTLTMWLSWHPVLKLMPLLSVFELNRSKWCMISTSTFCPAPLDTWDNWPKSLETSCSWSWTFLWENIATLFALQSSKALTVFCVTFLHIWERHLTVHCCSFMSLNKLSNAYHLDMVAYVFICLLYI